MKKSKDIYVKIIKSTGKYYWYKNKIGDIFKVKKIIFNKHEHFIVIGTQRRISKSDCVEIGIYHKINKIKERIKCQ